MYKRAAKRRYKKEGSGNSMDGDRLSELPQPILHHILSFFSQKEAVQTCVLSKSWRYLGSTRPNLEFCQYLIPGNTETFLSALDNTLQRYLDLKLSIDKIVLGMRRLGLDQSVPLLEKWIPIVLLNMVVKDFSLSASFDLPMIVFQAQSLQHLYLGECKINHINEAIMLKQLQTLTLKDVDIADQTFEKIMSSCPLIESVFLFTCDGLRTINVNKKSHVLKEFEFCNDFGREENEEYSIAIEAPSLESIVIRGCSNWLYRHMHFPNLKSLELEEVRLCSELFNLFSCNLPVLEKLTLLECFGFEELIQLSNRSIRHLVLRGMDNSVKAIFDIPKVVTFRYGGKKLPSISFASTTSCVSDCKLDLWFDVKIDTTTKSEKYVFSSSWFYKLRKLLSTMSQSEITLKVSLYKGWRINDDEQLNEDDDIEIRCGLFDKPVQVKSVVLIDEGGPFSSTLPGFLSCLFCVCRPRYVCHHWTLDTVTLCKLLVVERDTEHCYFWQQDLKEVIMEGLDVDGKEWRRVYGSTSNPDRSARSFRFRLKWKGIE